MAMKARIIAEFSCDNGDGTELRRQVKLPAWVSNIIAAGLTYRTVGLSGSDVVVAGHDGTFKPCGALATLPEADCVRRVCVLKDHFTLDISNIVQHVAGGYSKHIE